MNEENLIQYHDTRTPSERRECASAAGRASGRARRIQSTGRKLVQDLLALRQPDPKIVADLERYGVNVKDLTNEVAMTLRQIDKAIRRADTVAYNAVLKAAGYLTEDVNVGVNSTEPGGLGIRIIDTRKPEHEHPSPAPEHPEDAAPKLENK